MTSHRSSYDLSKDAEDRTRELEVRQTAASNPLGGVPSSNPVTEHGNRKSPSKMREYHVNIIELKWGGLTWPCMITEG